MSPIARGGKSPASEKNPSLSMQVQDGREESSKRKIQNKNESNLRPSYYIASKCRNSEGQLCTS